MTVLLSDLVGLRVRSPDGRVLGRVCDLTVRLGPTRPVVRRVLVRRDRTTGWLLPAGVVHRLGTRPEVLLDAPLPTTVVDPRAPGLDDGELLLARDVMDTQVVDLGGFHLSRVSEVLLEPVGEQWEVVAVDLGLAGLLHRVGLARRAAPARWRAVPWQDVHLTSPRGHGVQLSVDTAAFRRLDTRGLADLLGRLSTARAADVVRAVGPARGAAALHVSHPRTGSRIVGALSGQERTGLAAGATAPHAHTIRMLGRHASPLHHRRFRRTHGWRRHLPPAGGP